MNKWPKRIEGNILPKIELLNHTPPVWKGKVIREFRILESRPLNVSCLVNYNQVTGEVESITNFKGPSNIIVGVLFHVWEVYTFSIDWGKVEIETKPNHRFPNASYVEGIKFIFELAPMIEDVFIASLLGLIEFRIARIEAIVYT